VNVSLVAGDGEGVLQGGEVEAVVHAEAGGVGHHPCLVAYNEEAHAVVHPVHLPPMLLQDHTRGGGYVLLITYELGGVGAEPEHWIELEAASRRFINVGIVYWPLPFQMCCKYFFIQ